QPRRSRHPFQSGAPQQVELKPLARDDPRFDSARRAGKRDLRIRPAAQDLSRDGNTREQMPSRSPSRDHDAQRPHASAAAIVVVTTCEGEACCDTFSSIAMPIMLMSSDDPPALTNGSGIPFVGSSPSTTLMLKNAWNATIVVRPIARNAPKRSGARI